MKINTFKLKKKKRNDVCKGAEGRDRATWLEDSCNINTWKQRLHLTSLTEPRKTSCMRRCQNSILIILVNEGVGIHGKFQAKGIGWLRWEVWEQILCDELHVSQHGWCLKFEDGGGVIRRGEPGVWQDPPHVGCPWVLSGGQWSSFSILVLSHLGSSKTIATPHSTSIPGCGRCSFCLWVSREGSEQPPTGCAS